MRLLVVLFATGALGVLFGCSTVDEEAVVEDGGLVAGHAVFDVAKWNGQFRASEMSAQEKVRSCMAHEGFEYEPSPPISGLTKRADDALLHGGLSDAEFASEFGFGVSTFQDFFFGEDTSEEEPAKFETPPTGNSAASDLSGPELKAFERALYGDGSIGSGCMDSSYAEHREWSNAIGPLHDQIDRTKASFLLDARVVEFYQAWSLCMVDRGNREYVAPMQVHKELSDAMADVLTVRNQRQLDDLRAFEVQIAADTVACGESSHNLLPPDLVDVWNDNF